MKVTIKKGEDPREKMVKVWGWVKEAAPLTDTEITGGELSKSDMQRKKYHAMIGDFANQITFDGTKKYDEGTWKARSLEQFAKDKELMGEPLRHGSKTVMSLDLERIITVRPSSEKLGVKEAADFIEYLYSKGAEMDVVWSDPEHQSYNDYKEAQ